MSRAQLIASRALWRRREAFRKSRHAAAVNRFDSAGIKKWGDLLREARAMVAKRTDQLGRGAVALPVDPIISSSWGYHPGVHDGIDLITEGDDTVVAICDGVVVRASSSGWWGKGARPSNGHPISDGDGVIVLRSTTTAGPFKPGLNFVYGHAEHPSVKSGQKVKAGDKLGRAGFANAWHLHFCVNNRTDDRGVGDRDPRPFLDYARKHGRR